MEYGILGLVVLVIDIYAIFQVLSSSASGGAKILWTLGILVFPIIGAIVWFVAGPKASPGAI